MNRASRTTPGPEADPESFYDCSWRSSRWGQEEPNDDERSRLSAIVELLDGCALPERAQILDLGCGRGWLTRALVRYGDVLGTDVVGACVERARELFPDLSFEQTDIPSLLVRRGPACFDVVVSSEVLEHVKDAEKPDFVAGIAALLKPDGCAVLTTPRGELWPSWQRGRDWRQPVEEWISEVDLDHLAADAGLRVERRMRAHVYGITPLSRAFRSRLFRGLVALLPPLEGLTYRWRIYQVVLLRPASGPREEG